MVQTITELFNNISVAPQPTNLAPATFNGVIKSASAPQSTINVGPSVPKPNIFIQPVGNPIIAPIGGGMMETVSPVNLTPPPSQIGEIINTANAIPQQPETKLNAGTVSLASPFRNTASTRIIG